VKVGSDLANNQSRQRSLAYGASMADQLLALRANDGSKSSAPYIPQWWLSGIRLDLPSPCATPSGEPCLSSINGIESPPFPDFLSGHSAMGGTFASVMTHFFGDKLTFAATSEELPGVTRQFAGFKDQAGVKRISFYQAGLEDALSRIYGGRAHPRGLSGFL
jgi:hypothetical protein